MSYEQDTASLRQKIGQHHAMLAQCDAQDEAITKGATERMKQVVSRLDELRTKALLDHAAADEYLELTKEKGALLRTLAG
jgi:predicted trehalose synthase